MDALLGAASLGDIGKHFPDTEEIYRGCSSLWLLTQTCALIQKAGFQPVHIDATVIAEAPKLAPYTEKMRQKIAQAIQLSPQAVNIKATTTEGLGFTGRGEGIAGHGRSGYCADLKAKKGSGFDAAVNNHDQRRQPTQRTAAETGDNGRDMQCLIAQNHGDGRMHQNAAADINDDGVAVHQFGEISRTPYQDRDGEQKAKHNKMEIAVRYARYAQHIIKSHREGRLV